MVVGGGGGSGGLPGCPHMTDEMLMGSGDQVSESLFSYFGLMFCDSCVWHGDTCTTVDSSSQYTCVRIKDNNNNNKNICTMCNFLSVV